MRHYTDRILENWTQFCLSQAKDKTSSFYDEYGNPCRTRSVMAPAFWDGYEGKTFKGPNRSIHAVYNTPLAAALKAGKEYRKIEKKDAITA